MIRYIAVSLTLPLRNLTADAVDVLITAMGGATGAAVGGLVGIETGVGEFNTALRAGQAGLRLAAATEGVVVATRATAVINATDAALGASKAALGALSLMSAAKDAGAPGACSASDASSLVQLEKSLASEQQVGELVSGQGQVMAGKGGRVPIRDEPRLINQYGGKAGGWQKVRSSSYTASDGTVFETHAYQNAETGEVVESKTKPSTPNPND